MSKRNGKGVSTLKLDPHNARKHPDRNKAQIAASLKELGAGRSILVDATDTIIAGNGVYEQAQALGYKVKVIEADGKTLIAVKRPDLKGARARRMALADNRATETSEWDVDILADLAANDAEALAGLFDERELRDLLGDKMPGSKEETADAGELVDKAAELQAKWQVKRGEVWMVGKHRVMCGDSTNAADVARLMGGDRAQAIATDPPYSSGGLHKGARSKNPNDKYKQTESTKNYENFSGDNRDQRSFIQWCSMWLNDWRELCDLEAYLFVFSDWRQVPSVSDAIQVAGWLWRGINVWDKTEGARMASQAYFRAQAEFALWATNGQLTPRYQEGGDTFPGVFLCSVDSDKEHLTQKPVKVIEWLIGITRAGGIVVDPFVGSGTTLVACEQTGRIGRGMEISEKYVAVTLERLSLLGLTPKRIDDGNGKAKRKTKATA